MKHKIRIAIYMRLSQDDGDFEAESASIGNQRQLLHSYVQKHFTDYELEEYQDDGYTGANMDRPGVKALLNKVKTGLTDCIIVKDLSRFSRDYIEIGTYLERIFPFTGVRFIAVNDGYDSGQFEGDIAGMDTTFKNLINDLYCKDISVKVKSALKIKKEKGIYANGSCTFGYRKDPNDRHRLLVDEEEAAIVRRIFQMTLNGVSSHKIARQFNAEGVKTPIEYKMERGVAKMTPKGQRFEWNGSTICQMLRNATYAGDFVYDKYETPEVSGKSRLKPRSQWKIIRNHHEAIIDRNMFDQIQKSRRIKSKIKYASHPLTGKIECGCCHRALKLSRTKNPYFYCGNRYVTRYEGCLERINVQFLEQYLLFALHEETKSQLKLHTTYIELKDRISRLLSQERERRMQTERALKKLQTEKAKLYEAYIFREIDEGAYTEAGQGLQKKLDECANQITISSRRIEMLEDQSAKEGAELYNCVQEHSLTELTKAVADRFIKRIIIYDETHMEVEWRNREKLPEELLRHQLADI